MAKQRDKQFKLDAVQYYQDSKDLGVRGCAENLGIGFTVIATLCHQMNSNEYIKKERPFFLEVFRHMGHSEHLLFTAELPICSRNAETPKTVFRCIVSGRFWAFSLLLFCPEAGVRERYSIICYAFSFCWQPLYQWQHRR